MFVMFQWLFCFNVCFVSMFVLFQCLFCFNVSFVLMFVLFQGLFFFNVSFVLNFFMLSTIHPSYFFFSSHELSDTFRSNSSKLICFFIFFSSFSIVFYSSCSLTSLT